MGHDTFVFGPYVFEPRSLELRRDGAAVPLQAQPARVLALLLGRAGETVTRDEIRHHLWGDTHVDFDRGLNFCIRRIRAALGEAAATSVCIETLPRRGYRWIAPVRKGSGHVTVPATLDAGRRRWPAWGSPGRLVSRRVPLWATAVVTAAAVLSSLAIQGTLEPVDVSFPRVRADPLAQQAAPGRLSRLKLAVNALHVLSHALVDGRDTPASQRALRTLEVLALSSVGLASESDLPR